MNILIDIGHPAHVHLFKHIAHELQNHGHNVFYSVRDIPVAKRLMEVYGMTPYVDLGKKKDSLFGKAFTILNQDFKLFFFVLRHHIDIGLSSGIVLSHISKFTPLKSIVFDDDDDDAEKFVVKFGHPFSNTVFTPDCIHRKTSKAIYYAGTHELAYLHPNRFVPDKSTLDKAGIHDNEPFFIVRFVAFKGHHDIGQEGLNINQKRKLINLLKKHGRVIITSERQIEPEFEEYRLPVPPEDIHSLMYYASMFVGDSQTMTSEAALLGVPAIKCNTFAGNLSVPNELEQKYKLCFAYHPKDFDSFYAHIQQLLDNPHTKQEWETNRKTFLKDKIDVSAFVTWYIENYPDSCEVIKNNPNQQYDFR